MGHPVLNHEINSQGNWEGFQEVVLFDNGKKNTTKYIRGNNASLKEKKKMRTGKYFTKQLNVEIFLGKDASLVVQDACFTNLQISDIT